MFLAAFRSRSWTVPRISAVEVWWWKSRRLSATFAWARATRTRALSLFLLPSAVQGLLQPPQFPSAFTTGLKAGTLADTLLASQGGEDGTSPD
jgi:hypothetical protein